MDSLSKMKTDHLFWLGRYIMRSYTELEAALALRDQMLDGQEADYKGFCTRIGAADIYKDADDWKKRFFFDEGDPESIASSLSKAYDNAIVCRETISSVAMSYIQMAISALEKAENSPSPGVAFQWVFDDLLAFRGCIEEKMVSEYGLDVVKIGLSLEKLDLSLRLGRPAARCLFFIQRLERYASRTGIIYDPVQLTFLKDALTLAAQKEEQGIKEAYKDKRQDLIAACEQLAPGL